MMWSKEAISYLDKYYAPCGPCALCGHRDKRHRLWDAFLTLSENGYSPDEISEEHDVSIEHVEAVLLILPYRRGGSAHVFRKTASGN
jgi:hypothetical protein